MSKDDARAANRPERVPLFKQQVFTAPNRPGFIRRWVNDLPGRIDAFKKAGWTIAVEDIENTHNGLAQVESQLGTTVTRVVNRGLDAPCRNAVLMEIDEEWYRADKAEQQRLIEITEAAFDRHGVHKSTGMYGSIQRANNTKAT